MFIVARASGHVGALPQGALEVDPAPGSSHDSTAAGVLRRRPGFDPSPEDCNLLLGPRLVTWHRTIFQALEDVLRMLRNVLPLPEVEVGYSEHRSPISFPE
jgi:hypothetical protein